MSLLPVGQRGQLTFLNFDILTSMIIIVVSNVIYLVNSVFYFSKSSFYKILLLLKVIIQHVFRYMKPKKTFAAQKIFLHQALSVSFLLRCWLLRHTTSSGPLGYSPNQ